MLSRKSNKDPAPITPPDVNNPPSYIPLRSLDERYQIVEELGNGSFGSVSLARVQFDVTKFRSNGLDSKIFTNTLLNQTHMEHENSICKRQGLVAIKTMMTKLSTLHDYTRVREIKFILSIPANKHLIQIFEIFIDNKNFQLHIVMECMEQNLYQMMRHRRRRVFSIPSLRSILAQILAGLTHIHDQNFFHRDIKPENILISPSTRYFDKSWLTDGNYTDNYVVKLADFGLARHITNKNPYTAYVSTRWYRSPEILLRNGYYSRPLDIWAFGCVAVEITTFKPLFPGSNEMDQIWKILEVLGTPHMTKESERTGYVSSGGSWELAKSLAQRLDMKFPYVEGTGLQDLISSSQLQDLTHVIKSCLRWDPNGRVTARDLCSMPFFHKTVADLTKNSTNTEQALNFAGVNSASSNNKRQLIFHSKELLVNKGGTTSLSRQPIDIIDENSSSINLANENIMFSINDFLDHENIPLKPPQPFDVNDTDSTISDNHEDIEICHMGKESSQHLQKLTSEIDQINKADCDFYFGTRRSCNSKNYIHYNENNGNNAELNLLNNNNVITDSDHSSLQPVNRLMDNMSIDDSFNGNTNINVIPRSFILQQQEVTNNNNSHNDHDHDNENMGLTADNNQYFGNITF